MVQINLPGTEKPEIDEVSADSQRLPRTETNQEKSTDLRAKYLSPLDLQLRREHDPILEALPGSAKPLYLRVRGEVRQGLVNGLAKTLRWQNSPYQIDPDFRENDLEHVVALLGWCNDIEKDYPALYQAICGGDRENWHDFLTMLTLHDIGEIGVGDMVLPLLNTKQGLRHKKLEPRWAKYALRQSLEAQEAKRLSSIYDRFEEPADDDTMALAAKVLDRGQGSVNVALHLIPFNQDNPSYMRKAFIDDQTNTLRYAERLIGRLPSPEARNDLRAFLKDKVIDHFNASGVPEIAALQQLMRDTFPNVYSEDWLKAE